MSDTEHTQPQQPLRSETTTPGVSLVEAGRGQVRFDHGVVRDVGPRATEWLPKVLDTLLPAAVQTVRELAMEFDSRILRDRHARIFPRACLQEEHGIGSWELNYTDQITRFAIPHHDGEGEVDDNEAAIQESLRETLTSVGTGRGELNAGLERIRETVVPLLNTDTEVGTPVLVLFLDGVEWSEVEDKRTAARALDAIAAIGEACDVRLVCSPRLQHQLDRDHPDWTEAHLDLTESGDGSRPAPHVAESSSLTAEVFDVIGDFEPSGGRLRLLDTLSGDESREVRDLKNDAEIDLSAGSIDRYVQELADEYDLIAIDDRRAYNRVSLTSRGEAAQQLIGPNSRVQHPEQRRLDSGLTPTQQSVTSRVYSPKPWDGDSPSREGAVGTDLTAEEWLADTGEAHEDGYVRWLGGADCRLDAWELHDRLLAGRRIEGVTVVDEDVERYDDGRVTYVTCFEDHAQVIAQWGGPLCTLVRLPSALLSDKMWSKVLTPSALGDDLGEVYEGALNDAVQDVLRLGSQLGWFSEDEVCYDGLRERYQAVRRRLLSELSTVQETDDQDEWSEFCRDAHGLLASVTHLYRAVGVDVTFNIRIPDTTQLRRGNEYQRFLSFMKYTVPKQSAYGCHSVYRMMLEKREDKLKHRLPVEFGDANPKADLTASWVISGPTASTYREDIQSAIASRSDDIREAIRDGGERGVDLSIPVVDGNGYAAIRRVINQHVEQKGFTGTGRDDVRDLARLLAATLGERPGRCSPYAAAEALLAIAKANRPQSTLSAADVTYGVSQLPSDRIFPALPPSSRKMVKVLLASDEPLGRSTVIERAGISGGSYDRHIGKLAAFGIAEDFGNGSTRRWRAYLDPWWSPTNDRSKPRASESETSFGQRWDDVLYEVAMQLGLEHDWEVFASPTTLEDIFDALPRIRHWRPIVMSLFGFDDRDDQEEQCAEISPQAATRQESLASRGVAGDD